MAQPARNNARHNHRGTRRKSARYRAELAARDDWDEYLHRESGLPGPRANLELMQVAADLGDRARFERWLANDRKAPDEYLVVCALVGLGRLIAENAPGKSKFVKTLHRYASDPRWRAREGVAMGLQRWGDANMDALLAEMDAWADGSPLEQRAVVAALCEPRLLKQPAHAKRVLKLLERIMRNFAGSTERKSDGFAALKKTLGYGWSVAIAALPAAGTRALDKWFASDDKDVRAVLRENLTKDRLKRADPDWVKRRAGELT